MAWAATDTNEGDNQLVKAREMSRRREKGNVVFCFFLFVSLARCCSLPLGL